jgi:hypothetical protein
VRFHLTRSVNQREHFEAMVAGLKAHDALDLGEDVDCCWGWRRGIHFFRAGRRVLILERGYIGDRYHYTSIAWNGLNNRAEFPHYPLDDGTRFRSMGELKPWNNSGEYVLLIGQLRGDMSLKGKNLRLWYETSAEQARQVWGLPVVFRPHPEERVRSQNTRVPGCDTDLGDLAESLERAAVVITFNSNTGVDAMLAGKPTVVCDRGGMAWPVAAHHIGGDCLAAYREAWAWRLSWKQWTLDEIASGAALVGIVEVLRASGCEDRGAGADPAKTVGNDGQARAGRHVVGASLGGEPGQEPGSPEREAAG